MVQKGIGTGFSTDIMCYNPKDIIAYLKNKLQGTQGIHGIQDLEENTIDFMPYYEGFKVLLKKYLKRSFCLKECITLWRLIKFV